MKLRSLMPGARGVGGDGFHVGTTASAAVESERLATYDGLGATFNELAFAGTAGVDYQAFVGIVAPCRTFTPTHIRCFLTGESAPPCQLRMAIYQAAPFGAGAVLLNDTGVQIGVMGLNTFPLAWATPMNDGGHRYYLSVCATAGAVIAMAHSMTWTPPDSVEFNGEGITAGTEPPCPVNLAGFARVQDYIPWVEVFN